MATPSYHPLLICTSQAPRHKRPAQREGSRREGRNLQISKDGKDPKVGAAAKCVLKMGNDKEGVARTVGTTANIRSFTSGFQVQ